MPSWVGFAEATGGRGQTGGQADRTVDIGNSPAAGGRGAAA